MTLEQFAEVYAVLAVQLGDHAADTVKIRAYFKVLSDLEVEFVQAAAEQFAHTSDGWFPKAPEWRAAAQVVESRRRDELRAVLRKRTEPLCLACGDTSWEPVGDGGAVRPCACRASRRLEVLGRRPMPALEDGASRVPIDADAIVRQLSN